MSSSRQMAKTQRMALAHKRVAEAKERLMQRARNLMMIEEAEHNHHMHAPKNKIFMEAAAKVAERRLPESLKPEPKPPPVVVRRRPPPRRAIPSFKTAAQRCDSDPWACGTCTFSNQALHLTCGMCGSLKVVDVAAEAAAAGEPPAAIDVDFQQVLDAINAQEGGAYVPGMSAAGDALMNGQFDAIEAAAAPAPRAQPPQQPPRQQQQQPSQQRVVNLDFSEEDTSDDSEEYETENDSNYTNSRVVSPTPTMTVIKGQPRAQPHQQKHNSHRNNHKRSTHNNALEPPPLPPMNRHISAGGQRMMRA